MVNEEKIDLVFKALGDSTRRGILEGVAKGNPTVGELAAPFEMSAPAISKHLKVLEGAGLVTRIREGKVSRFRLNPEPFGQAETVVKQLAGFWLERLDRLGEVLDVENEEEKTQKREESPWWNQEKENWMY